MDNTSDNVPNDSSLSAENEGGPIKPFLEHLEDVRWVLIKSVSALGVSMLVCLLAAPTLIALLKRPVFDAGLNVDLEPFGPMGGMGIWMKIAFMVIPVQVLIEVCILISRRWERQKLARKQSDQSGWLLILCVAIGHAAEALAGRAGARWRSEG